MVKPIFARDFFRGPCLSGNAARTFRLHLAYALLDATAGGILLNAPLIAIKSFQAANWHLPLREIYSGLGMLLALYLGSRMASRRKMPFIFIPGVAAGLSVAMTRRRQRFGFSPCWVGPFEIVTRPAITAVLRLNYPVERRPRHGRGTMIIAQPVSASPRRGPPPGLPAGRKRWRGCRSQLGERILRWSAEHGPGSHGTRRVSQPCQLCLLPAIDVGETIGSEPADRRLESVALPEAVGVLAHDGRTGGIDRVLSGRVLQMLYFMIWNLLSRDLGFGYVSYVPDARPAGTCRVFATGWLGKLFDRTNPWLVGVRPLRVGSKALLRVPPLSAFHRPVALPVTGQSRVAACGMVDSVVASESRYCPGRIQPLHGHRGLSQWIIHFNASAANLARRLAPDARRRWNRRHFLGFLFALSSRC